MLSARVAKSLRVSEAQVHRQWCPDEARILRPSSISTAAAERIVVAQVEPIGNEQFRDVVWRR